MFLFAAPDVEYKTACIKAYNDWLAEFCQTDPDRFIGAAMLPVGAPIETVLDETRRVLKNGLRTVMLPAGLPKIPFGEPYYHPLFAQLQETGTPLSIHNAASEQQFAPVPNTRRRRHRHLS